MYISILKFQQLKLKVWRRLHIISFRFLSWSKLPKLIFRYSANYIILKFTYGCRKLQVIKLAQNTISLDLDFDSKIIGKTVVFFK